MSSEDDIPLGLVPVEGRGSLPFALVHGESLVAAASWAVGEAGFGLYDATVSFDRVRRSARALVVHDPLCPLTPVAFLLAAAARSAETGAVVVGFRPVTDTVKVLTDGRLGATVDRTRLRSVTSPVVIPAEVLAGLEHLAASDFADLVAQLAAHAQLEWLEAPALSHRVRDEDDLLLLEALSRAAGASA